MLKPDFEDYGPPIAEDERRTEVRYASVESAVVTIITEGQSVVAETVDVSKSGLRIRLMDPLEIGERIRVKFGTVIAFGEVRWCRQSHAGNYEAGIAIGHTMAQTFLSGIREAIGRVKSEPDH